MLLRRALQLFAAAALFAGIVQSHAVELAPYFNSWTAGAMTQTKNARGMTSAVVGFAVTNGNCALKADLTSRFADIRAFTGAGGQAIISFGGADGIYAEIACTDDDQLFNLVDRLIVDSGVRRIDWEIEGHQLLNTDATARRARVLARMQNKYPDLRTSFTLPGWLLGFDNNGMNLLRTTLAAGVRISMVNVMAMSFGYDQMVPASMGQAVITTFRATANQIAPLFPGKSQGQMYAMMGVVPMIGRNDDGRIFTLADAQAVADFAKANGVGLLSYWSFQRDLTAQSGVAQADYQFFSIFKTATGSVVQMPSPAPAPVPAPTTCSSMLWVQGMQYAAGSIVTYGNAQYIAKVANPGYNPTISTYFWGRYVCGGAAPAPAPAPTACAAPNWVMGKQYAAGFVVTYTNGFKYRAKFANPGYDPTVSTYFWARYYC